jgi:hypothetical protein
MTSVPLSRRAQDRTRTYRNEKLPAPNEAGSDFCAIGAAKTGRPGGKSLPGYGRPSFHALIFSADQQHFYCFIGALSSILIAGSRESQCDVSG